MIKIDYLNFDSVNSIDTSGDSFDSTFTILQKYKNIHKIYLKNCEIPVGFSNIRSQNNSNVLNFTLNGVTYNATIASGVYSTLLSVITALNASILSAISATSFTFVMSLSSGNKVIITTTGACC